MVELLGCPDQADDPLLDQVEQREAVPLVALGDRDDEAQVRVDHQVLRLLVAALDALRELDLLLGGEQLVPPRLVQEELERVRRRIGELVVGERRVVLADAAAVVRELDPALVELLVAVGELVLVEVELVEQLAELGQVHAPLLLGLIDQRCQPVQSRLPVCVVPDLSSTLTAGGARSSRSIWPCSATARIRASCTPARPP